MQRESDDVNRTVKTNDLYKNSSKKRRLVDLWGDVEGCSTEELNRLKQEIHKVNKSFTDEEINDLKDILANKLDESITLSKQQPVEINYNLLFRQFNEIQQQQQQHSLLFHNFTKKEKAFEKLYQWSIFSNTIEPFFKPIHFRLFKKKLPLESYNENQSLDNKVYLQNTIIMSHFNPLTKITCNTLIGSLECELQGIIIECILFQDCIYFMIEWMNTHPFLFIIAFKIKLAIDDNDYNDESIKKTIEKIKIEHQKLSRHDLLDDESTKIIKSTKKTTFNIQWLRKAVRNASLSYIYYAYAKKQ